MASHTCIGSQAAQYRAIRARTAHHMSQPCWCPSCTAQVVRTANQQRRAIANQREKMGLPRFEEPGDSGNDADEAPAPVKKKTAR